jgi:hypothetical protein
MKSETRNKSDPPQADQNPNTENPNVRGDAFVWIIVRFEF